MPKISPIPVQKDLKGINYPVSKPELIQHAQQQGADPQVRSALEQIPDQHYETPTEVSKAIGDLE